MTESLGISMVKNEADVIEAFVRHNLGFVDVLAMVDNDSADGTREILVRLQQEGLPIILFDDPVVAHFQAEIVTAVYRKVVPRFKPRFVFLLDADEFIVAPSREALYGQLRALRPGTQAQYRWRTYIPAPTGPEGDSADPLRSITYRKVSERPWWKPIIATQPKIDMKLQIQQGNHDVTLKNKSLPTVRLRDVVIAHFPVRSVDQLTGKVLSGWIANLERNRLHQDHGYAFHWKAIYDRIVLGDGLTNEDLTFEALRYAQTAREDFTWPHDVVREPVAPNYASLTTPSTIPRSPLQKVMKSVERIFNPDLELAGLAPIAEFLPDGNRKRRWPSRLTPSGVGDEGAPELCIDVPPFRHLADRYRPESVLELGSRSAVYLKYFAAHGARRTTGVGDFGDASKYPDEYVRADLGRPLTLEQTFDLVLHVDLIGHIPAQSEQLVIENIVRHARQRIVFSGARPISHWLDVFESGGWYPCLFDSLALRSISTLPWLSDNLIVLTRDSSGSAGARARLVELDRHTSVRNRQRPAAITHSFTDTAARLLASERGGRLTQLRSRLKRSALKA
jgi:hypothetical protein